MPFDRIATKKKLLAELLGDQRKKHAGDRKKKYGPKPPPPAAKPPPEPKDPPEPGLAELDEDTIRKLLGD